MNEAKKKTRRRHSAELKQQIIAHCAEPGASVARIALSYGINANVVHKWHREAGWRAACTPGPRIRSSAAAASGMFTRACTCTRHPHQAAPWRHRRLGDLERHIRGKWACAKCETLTPVPVDPHIIDKGILTTGLLAQVLVATSGPTPLAPSRTPRGSSTTSANHARANTPGASWVAGEAA